MEDSPKNLKIVLLGDAGVGKSSILLRFVANDFKENSESTIGAAFMAKTVTVNQKSVKLQIWDTAGQEKFHSLTPLYYRDAAVAIVVYDLVNSNSFESVKTWIREIRQSGPKNITIAIAGNKVDLLGENNSAVDVGKNFAKQENALFSVTSALENKGIEDLFLTIAEEVDPEVHHRNSETPQNLAGSKKSNQSSNEFCDCNF